MVKLLKCIESTSEVLLGFVFLFADMDYRGHNNGLKLRVVL